jgi:hypothetical protein
MLHLTSCEIHCHPNTCQHDCLGLGYCVREVGNKKAQSREALGESGTGVYGRGARPPSEHAEKDQNQHDN